MQNLELVTSAPRPFDGKALTCLFLAILADFLFFEQPLGWTLGLFGVLVAGALVLHNPEIIKQRTTIIIAFLTLGQCLALVLSVNKLSIVLTVLGIVSLGLVARKAWQNNAQLWLQNTLSLLKTLFCVRKRFRSHRKLIRKPSSQTTANLIIQGWFLPLSLTVIFLALLSQANPIIMSWLDGFDFVSFFKALSLKRVFFWIFSAYMLFSFIRPRFKVFKTKADTRREKLHEGSFLKWLFSKKAILRSLVIFNVMFGLQTMMDIAYLWQGAALPEGISYAQYARKGAYPLVFTAILAGVFAVISRRAEKDVSESPVIKALIYCWVAQNIFLVASSIFRTLLYIEFYSLTYMRLSALIWMGLVATGLIWIIAGIFWKKSDVWLMNVNAITLLTVLYVVSFINIGGFIAMYNVNNYTKMADIGNEHILDFDYIVGIGPVSIPALQKLANHEEFHQEPYYQSRVKRATKAIEDMKAELVEKSLNWRQWNYRDYHLLKSVMKE